MDADDGNFKSLSWGTFPVRCPCGMEYQYYMDFTALHYVWQIQPIKYKLFLDKNLIEVEQ